MTQREAVSGSCDRPPSVAYNCDQQLWTGIRKLAQPVFGDKIFKHEGSERPLWVRGAEIISAKV